MTDVPSRRAWWAVVAWLAFQLTLTSLPGNMLPLLPGFRIDWVAHFCLYFGLGFLLARAGMRQGWGPRQLALCWLAIAVLGALDEAHEQLFIPGRGAELMDWMMDAAGSGSGLAAAYLMKGHQWFGKLLR